MRARVNLREYGVNRGPGGILALIEDATDVGFSEYANQPGEAFFSLPYNHPVTEIIQAGDTAGSLELRAHIEIQRQASIADNYVTVGWALLTDHDSSEGDTVFYGDDYLSLFETSICKRSNTYTKKACSFVIQAEASLAITQSVLANSRLGFVQLGTIETTTQTATLSTDYMPRLDLMRSMCQIVQQGTSQRPILAVSRASPFTFTFTKNKGVDRPEIDLAYGGLIDDFRVRGGYGNVVTDVYAVGSKMSGSAVMYSHQTGLDAATYGTIQTARIYSALPDQATFDNIVKNDAKMASQTNRDLAMVIRSNALGPYDGYEIGDSVPVTIKRGRVNLDHAWYTIWGLEWIGHKDGSETTHLVLLPKLT